MLLKIFLGLRDVK